MWIRNVTTGLLCAGLWPPSRRSRVCVTATRRCTWSWLGWRVTVSWRSGTSGSTWDWLTQRCKRGVEIPETGQRSAAGRDRVGGWIVGYLLWRAKKPYNSTMFVLRYGWLWLAWNSPNWYALFQHIAKWNRGEIEHINLDSRLGCGWSYKTKECMFYRMTGTTTK